MNGMPEQEAKNEMSMLLKYYTQKVFSKIIHSRKLKQKINPNQKNRIGVE